MSARSYLGVYGRGCGNIVQTVLISEVSMTESLSHDRWRLICVFIGALLLLVFLKNAWVCDDAYIVFRSIEQLYAGNGPNWNHHERVQGYTSPLWYWLLAGLRCFSTDHFFNFILLSLVLFLLLGMLLQRYFGNGTGFASAMLLALSSNAFFDFTSSGLENILGYLLVAAGFVGGMTALNASDPGVARRHYYRALLAFALVPLCRHDLLVLTLLPSLVLVFSRPSGSGRQRMLDLFALALPLLFWSTFSLIYYGALFPNTAYAKLLTGISRLETLIQGLRYLLVTFNGDPVTILVILGALYVAWADDRRFIKAFGAGLVLNLIYVVWVGGDFMRGRFLALPFLLALLLLTETRLVERLIALRPSSGRAGGLVLAAYMLIFPHTPVNTWLNFQDFSIQHGVADERGYYFDVCSLYAWLYSQPGEVFPDFEWSHIGRQIATNGIAYLENDFNGMLGFWAGVKPVIIDRFALTDPFLARIPVSDAKNWRIGHFKREVPEEYRRSIETGQNKFSDAATAALFDKIQLATREAQLFTLKRFMAIVKLNCGIN